MHPYCKKESLIERSSNRRGYALLLVMVFVVLFSAILGVAWRRVASALRIEHVGEVRRQCDKGSIQALALAMQVLETRLRKGTDGIARIDASDDSVIQYKKQIAGKYYKIILTRTTTDGTKWSVSVTVAQASEVASLSEMPSGPP